MKVFVAHAVQILTLFGKILPLLALLPQPIWPLNAFLSIIYDNSLQPTDKLVFHYYIVTARQHLSSLLSHFLCKCTKLVFALMCTYMQEIAFWKQKLGTFKLGILELWGIKFLFSGDAVGSITAILLTKKFYEKI